MMNIVLLIILQQILLGYSFRCNKNLKRKIANDVESNGLYLFSQDNGYTSLLSQVVLISLIKSISSRIALSGLMQKI